MFLMQSTAIEPVPVMPSTESCVPVMPSTESGYFREIDMPNWFGSGKCSRVELSADFGQDVSEPTWRPRRSFPVMISIDFY